jgi:hypothetical protein
MTLLMPIELWILLKDDAVKFFSKSVNIKVEEHLNIEQFIRLAITAGIKMSLTLILLFQTFEWMVMLRIIEN